MNRGKSPSPITSSSAGPHQALERITPPSAHLPISSVLILRVRHTARCIRESDVIQDPRVHDTPPIRGRA